MKIVLVGHVCVDKNVVRGETETIGGGGVFHGGITAQRLGAEAIVITKCAESDRPSENPDERQSLLISRADPFSEADLVQIVEQKADVVHVNPLWLGEFPPLLLAALRPSVAMLCADAQGFLRVAETDGRLAHRDLAQKREVLSLLDLLKVDLKEAQVLTGEEDPRRAARAVHGLGPKMVLLTHRDGVCVYDGGTIHEGTFSGFTLEGRTGRGDTCTASFLVARGRGMGLAEAVAFAAEVTSRKMQYRGPYRG